MPSLSREQLNSLPPEQLKEILLKGRELRRRISSEGPQTRDQLHAWIKSQLGLDIPRVSVCRDHCAPFDFVADAFFGDVNSALVLANRSGAKTLDVAVLHYLNAEFKPGYEGLSFGAVQEQSDRAYEHLESWVKERDPDTGELLEKPNIIESLQKETRWRNGSKVFIVGSTPKQVNGPHPQLAHADEVDQMRADTYEESRNMATSKVIDGKTMHAQNILTSTRKSANGRMQHLIDENAKQIESGFKPNYKRFTWCIWETSAQVPNCRSAPENVDRPEDELCDCNRVVKGQMPDESHRTLDKVCKGRLFRSRGWKPLAEVQETFSQNNPAVWDAQQECSRPDISLNYIPEWDEERHGVRHYDPDPDNGPIYMGCDWGAGNPNGVGWFQRLRVPVEALGEDGEVKILPAESLVLFDELYEADIGAGKLAQKVIERERAMRNDFPGLYVKGRFADPQGRQQKQDFADAGLPCTWPVKTRDFEYQVELVQDLFVSEGDGSRDGFFFVDLGKCPKFVAEVGVWRRDEKGKQVDEFNHMMSVLRYAVSNIHVLERHEGRKHRRSSEVKRRSAGRARKPPASAGTGFKRVGHAIVGGSQRRSDYPDNIGVGV